MKLFVNVLIYQVIWFSCVLWENQGALIALPLLGLHLAFSSCRWDDIKMMVILLATGFIVDGSLYATGFFKFNVPAVPIPFWLAVIWLTLAILPHHSLNWMKQRILVSCLFGALGGPLAYWAGVRLGAATFTHSLEMSLFILALIWSIRLRSKSS